MILTVLLVWTLVSVPVSLLLGLMMRVGGGGAFPGWTGGDDRQLREWAAHRGRLDA